MPTKLEQLAALEKELGLEPAAEATVGDRLTSIAATVHEESKRLDDEYRRLAEAKQKLQAILERAFAR